MDPDSPPSKEPPQVLTVRPGDQVVHKYWGPGVIKTISVSNGFEAVVDFEREGRKRVWLLLDPLTTPEGVPLLPPASERKGRGLTIVWRGKPDYDTWWTGELAYLQSIQDPARQLEIAQIGSPKQREGLAGNPSLTDEVLRFLAADPVDEVRAAVARHPSATRYLLRRAALGRIVDPPPATRTEHQPRPRNAPSLFPRTTARSDPVVVKKLDPVAPKKPDKNARPWTPRTLSLEMTFGPLPDSLGRPTFTSPSGSTLTLSTRLDKLLNRPKALVVEMLGPQARWQPDKSTIGYLIGRVRPNADGQLEPTDEQWQQDLFLHLSPSDQHTALSEGMAKIGIRATADEPENR